MRNLFKPVLGTVLGFAFFLQGAEEDFQVFPYALPPDVTYPTGLAAAPDGRVFVCVDKNSSLDVEKGRGKIVQCVDTDGDGKADRFSDYVADIDSPRGACFVDETLYVVHPPFVSAFRDEDHDGRAEVHRVLVKGLGFDLSFRGADHTSNGVRMGIDGWLYLAIGDYGFLQAEGTDGSRLHLHGGGVVRVRPDGSRLEHWSLYARNIYDVAVSPLLDAFARDNTNDGKGWNTRLHHFQAFADHGYPRLYKNFPDEHLQPLADYGGGSGTGALYVDEPGIPEPYNRVLYTCDFTTEKVYLHPMEPTEATFRAGQQVFLDRKGIDLDVDGQGRLYISTWENGRYRYERPDVGGVYLVRFKGTSSTPFPNLETLGDSDLLKALGSDSAVRRLNAQRVLLRRPQNEALRRGLKALVDSSEASLAVRVAALFTWKQWLGRSGHGELVGWAAQEPLKEFALRALADHSGELAGVDAGLFQKGLQDGNARVRLQAAVGLGRLKAQGVTRDLLLQASHPVAPDEPLLMRDLPEAQAAYSNVRMLPHVAERVVVAIGSVQECLAALDDSEVRAAALRCLKRMHEPAAVDGLIARLQKATAQPEAEADIVPVLFRLYQEETPWDGKEWWTTRPDDRGPYFQPRTWSASDRIQKALEAFIPRLPENLHPDISLAMRRNRIEQTAWNVGIAVDEVLSLVTMAAPGSFAIEPLQAAALDSAREEKVRIQAFRALDRIPGIDAFKAGLAVIDGWHAQAPGREGFEQAVKDFAFSPEMGRRPKILRELLKKEQGRAGFWLCVAAINQVQSPLSNDYMRDLLNAELKKLSMRPWFLDAVAYMGAFEFEGEVKKAAGAKDAKVASSAQKILQQLEASRTARAAGKDPLADLLPEAVSSKVLGFRGDRAVGERMFARQGCVACHTVNPEQPPKGPYLGDAGGKWKRDYLLQSIIQPSAVVAQGFQTQVFEMQDESIYEGFVTAQEDGFVEVRNVAGLVNRLPTARITKRSTRSTSMMPEGLAANMTVYELASLLDYLQSLNGH